MRIVSDTSQAPPTASTSPSFVRFSFNTNICFADAEDTLLLAKLAVESLFGASRVSLETTYRFDEAHRTVEIDAAGHVGNTLAVIFNGYVASEFGESAVQVERLGAGVAR